MAMTSDGAPATRPAINSPTAIPRAAARPPATKAAMSADARVRAPGADAACVVMVLMRVNRSHR